MWQKINDFVHANTVFSALLFTVFFLLLTTAVGLPVVSGGIVVEAIGMPIFIAYQLALSLTGIWFMRKLHLLDADDFRFRNIGKGFLLGWVVLLLTILNFVLNFTSPPEGGFLAPAPLFLLTVILYPFIVSGLFEEVVFRGIVLKMLLRKMGGTKKGIISTFIISAALFGIVHCVHLFWVAPLTVFSDVILATAGGMFLGAIYLRTKTLIAPILLHGLFNLSSMIWWAFTSNGPVSAVETTLADVVTIILIGVIPLIIAAFVLLGKVKPEEQPEEVAGAFLR